MASEHNIALANMRCQNVANEARERMNNKSKYEVGKVLIARQWIKQPRVNKNIRYRSVEIGNDKLEDQITLQGIAKEEDEVMLFEALVDSNFIYSYCATCHSSQGTIVKESGSIH